MKFVAWLSFIILLSSSHLALGNTEAVAPLDPEIEKILKKTSLKSYFEKNHGQWDDQSLGRSKAHNLTARFYEDKVSFSILSDDKEDVFVYNMIFENSSDQNHLEFLNKKKGIKNYIGCMDRVSTYQEVRYINIYPKIDLRFYTNQLGELEFDFIVHPGGDPNEINYTLDGVDELKVDKSGTLNYCSPFGQLQSGKTFTYQGSKDEMDKVESNYLINNGSIGFNISAYNPSKALIIDPTVLEWSTYIGATGRSSALSAKLFLGDACVYVCGTDQDSGNNLFDYPTTPGSYPATTSDPSTRNIIVSKFDTLGNLMFSTYLAVEGGTSKLVSFDFDLNTVFFSTVINGAVDFIPGISATAFDNDKGPTTNANVEIVLGRLDENGSLLWSSYLGGDQGDILYNISVSDGIIAVGGSTFSPNFPLYQENYNSFTGPGSFFISKFDYDGNITYSSFLGTPGGEYHSQNSIITKGGYTALAVHLDNQYSFPITQNPAPTLVDAPRIYVHVIDDNNDEHYTTMYNNIGVKLIQVEFENDQLCILSYQEGKQGFTSPGAYKDNADSNFGEMHVYCIHAPNASLNFATFLGEGGSSERGAIQIENNEVYYGGMRTSMLSALDNQLFLHKFDPTGNSMYFKDYEANGEVLVGFKVINGSSLFYVNAIAGNRSFTPTPDAAQLVPLNNLYYSGYLLRTDNQGEYIYGTWISGENDTRIIEAIPDGDKIYVFGETTSGFPTTVGAFQTESAAPASANIGVAKDYIVMRINTAPCIDDLTPENEISPSNIEVCKNGTVPFITGTDVFIDLDSITHYLINGVLTPADNNFIVEYQWQINFNGTNLWQDIGGATSISHQPQPLTDDANFRRIALLQYGDCDFRDTSNLSAIDVNQYDAPQLPNDTVYYKCASSTIPLNVTAQGGTPPFNYMWTPTIGLSDPFSPTPSTSTNVSTIYNVEVMDANGCIFIEQYTVRVYDAEAGDEKINCIGTGVQIGTPHVAPGVPGFKYFWTPSTGLNNANIPQPIASPDVATTYSLTILGPDNCLVTDAVNVNPVQTIADAGVDKTYCFDGTVQIGEPNDPDYTFVWSPGRYLDNQQLSNPTVFADEIPNPNPYRYILTKIHNQTGCTDTDTVLVYVNRAAAGIDYCGPRFIGLPDHSGGLANYSWTVLSGDASSIIGQETTIQPFVAPNTTTTYRVDVEWNGVVCTDIVVVPDCGCLIPSAEAYSELNCPVGAPEYNTIIFAGSIDTSRYNYLWTPANGIPDPTSPFPQQFTATLTSPTVYTITSTLKANSNVSCSSSVTIYPPPDPFPFSHAVDTITCAGIGINIGGPSIPGWNASWSPDNGSLNQINIFDPIATTDVTATYIVTIEELSTECIIKDTAVLEVFEIIADAGEDQDICENSIVQLGTEAIPGLTYSWEPSAGLENNTSAQPIDTLFASTTFYLTVSDSANTCVSYDTLVYTVVANPMANAGEDITICQGGQGIQIGSPAIAGNVYLWSPSTGLDNPNIAQPFANPNSTTIYTLTVSNNADGCFSTDAITIEVSSNESLDAGPDLIGCINDQVMIGITTSQPGYSFEWSPATGLNNANIAQPTATITDTLTYTVTMTAPSGCVVQDQVFISPSIPSVDAGPDHDICENAQVTLGTPSIPGYIYSWSPTTDLNDPNIAQPIHTAGSDIVFTLTATDQNNCSDTDDVEILVQAITADAGPDQQICSQPVQIGAPNLGAEYTYSWSPAASLNNPNIANPLASPSIQTTYTLTITHVASNCTAADDVVVTPNAIANAGPDERVCIGESIQIGLMPDPSCSYSWSPAQGLDNPNISNPTVTINSTTTYTLVVSKGGCTSTDLVTVQVNPIPSVTLNAFEPICLNECVQIGPNPMTGYRYSWSPSDYLSNPNIANPIACPINTTTYTLEITDIASGCSTSASVSVSVSDDIALTPNAGIDKFICPTESTTIGVPNQNPTYTYAWSPQTYLSNPFLAQTSVNIPEDTPGEYEYVLIATNINTGCQGRDTVLVTLNEEPEIPLIPDVTICQQGEYTICEECVPNPNYVYSWTPSNEVDSPDSLITNVSPFTTSTFNLSVFDINTLCTNSTSITIFVNDEITPNANAGPDQIICLDESIAIGSSDNGYSYTWFPEEHRNLLSNFSVSNPIFSPVEQGEFTLWVEATNSEGCVGVDTIVISVLEDATLDAGTSFITCSTEVTLNGTIDGALGFWSLFSGPSTPNILSPNSSTTQVTNLQAGVYKFAWSVNSANVCNTGDLDLVTVQVFAAPQINLSYECTLENNQSHFTYSFTVDGNGLNGTYNVSGFNAHNDLNYNQTYGPFGPVLITATSYDLVVETNFLNCEDVTEVITPNCVEYDYGDLPDNSAGTGIGNYETLSQNNGPRHPIDLALRLANFIDSESQGQESVDALGDGDDEDTFPFLNYLEAIKGANYKLPFFISNSTNQTAYLKIWVDWNADGDFADADEFVTDISDDGNGNFVENHIDIIVPDHALNGSLVGLRARLSTQNNLSPYGLAIDGEVEDYLFRIIENDDICLPLVIIIEGDDVIQN